MALPISDGAMTPARASARERLIVALDVPSAAEAHDLVQQVGDAADLFKVGLQLFTAEGPAFVRELIRTGHKVFLDLKFHDIPNTVGQAVKQAAELGVSMLTLHGSGGAAMLKAATDAAGGRVSLLAVTVLTSMNDDDLQEVGIAGRPLDQVLRIAALAKAAGLAGVVASAQEAAQIRKALGEGFAIVTPGVRPAGSSLDDQQRVATPAGAIAAGATHLVIGRPISHAANPAEAARSILQEIEQAQAARRT
ncbi:MAG TPA: orotidine-5'-phosphate decarboxylase [Candidatus Acidoferrales bacterium]|nr:orotidine-5'-phosphate decarboxylase [Candidatus Acidoferrales bacterium]